MRNARMPWQSDAGPAPCATCAPPSAGEEGAGGPTEAPGSSPSEGDPYGPPATGRALPMPPPLAERPTDGEEPDPVALVPPPSYGAPPPPPASRSGSPAVDETLPREVTDVADGRAWNVIVIHHSATATGSATSFDRTHRAKGEAGIGYHFVIGNGTSTGDGALETTFRWAEQRDGAHAKGWDAQSIGICLVGNFEEARPSPAQMRTLVLLVRHLRARYGIPGERVMAHSAVNATKCPGARFSMRDLVAASDPGPSPRGP